MTRRSSGAEWAHVAWVESETVADDKYEIKHRADGAWRCECLAFRFCRGQIGTPGKRCKHLDAFIAAGGVQMHARRDPTPQVRVTVGTERFTVRRAITFGELRP